MVASDEFPPRPDLFQVPEQPRKFGFAEAEFQRTKHIFTWCEMSRPEVHTLTRVGSILPINIAGVRGRCRSGYVCPSKNGSIFPKFPFTALPTYAVRYCCNSGLLSGRDFYGGTVEHVGEMQMICREDHQRAGYKISKHRKTVVLYITVVAVQS